MTEQIIITNQASGSVSIEIEGLIGVPEKWQFENPEHRVATYETFRKKVEEIKKLDAKEVIVNIRSTGGNVNDALLILDALQGLGAKVTTRCYGYVASAATIIAQAASNGLREISGNSLYLIHRSICSTEGNKQELEKSLELLGKTDERIAAVYAMRSGKNEAGFIELMGENNGNGRWLSPAEVVELGLADKIIVASPIKAKDRKMVFNLGLPPIPKKRKAIGSEKTLQWNTMLEKIGFMQNIIKKEEVIKEKEAGWEYDATKEKPVDQEIVETKFTEIETISIIEEISNVNKKAVKDKRSLVRATMTKAKEDPSPQELAFSQNDEAYINDLRKFV